MIRLDCVSFTIHGRQVIKDLSLAIGAGEVVAIVGRSGAGKSTLVNLITGLFTPTSGTIDVGGAPTAPGMIRGVVFQEESLLGWLSARENIVFGGTSRASADHGRVDALLQNVGLASTSNDLPGALSAGMRKRVELARALYADSRWLVVDEPFGTLDAVTRRELWHLWRSLQAREPRTGVLCTHDPEEAVRLCNRICVLGGMRPASVRALLDVPDEFHALSLDESTEGLEKLKRRIFELLGVS